MMEELTPDEIKNRIEKALDALSAPEASLELVDDVEELLDLKFSGRDDPYLVRFDDVIGEYVEGELSRCAAADRLLRLVSEYRVARESTLPGANPVNSASQPRDP